MPKEWYLMSRPLFNSGYESDEFLAFGQDGFQEVLESAVAEDVLVYDMSIQKEPKTIRSILQNVTSDSSNGTYIRQILCPIGELKCGQYIKARDSFWLVSTPPDNNFVYEKAVLWKCKYTIRFRSPLTDKIVEYPIFSINSTQYGTGEYNRTYISIGEGQHLVYLPCNEETVLIDDRFRFILDRNRQLPSVYRVTQVDNTSYAEGSEDEGGLIEWHTTETQFNEATDSKELMIADYYKTAFDPGKDDEDESRDEKINLYDLDEDQLITIGEEKQIRVAYQSGDTEVSLLDYTAEIESEDSICEIISQNEDIVILFVPRNRELIGKKFQLHVSCERLSLEARLSIQIVNW